MHRRSRKTCTKSDWEHFWIDEYRHFCRIAPGACFSVESETVIAFLIDLKKRGKKAWQRLQAVESIRSSAKEYFRVDVSQLQDIVDTLGNLAQKEKEDAEGPEDRSAIPEYELEIIKRLRRSIRRNRLAIATEKSYVGYANDFIERFELDDDPDWSRVSRREIELYLTDIKYAGTYKFSAQFLTSSGGSITGMHCEFRRHVQFEYAIPFFRLNK